MAHFGASKTLKFKLCDIHDTLFHWIHESTLKYVIIRSKTIQKMDFYHKNYEFPGEKKVFGSTPVMNLGVIKAISFE